MFGTHQHFGGKKVDRNARKCLPKNPDRRDGRRAAATSPRLGTAPPMGPPLARTPTATRPSRGSFLPRDAEPTRDWPPFSGG